MQKQLQTPLWWVRSRASCARHMRDPRALSWSTHPWLWFADFHAYHRVHAKTFTYSIRRAKQLVPDLFGRVAPDTFRRCHDSGAPNAAGRPSTELPPVALSRLSNLTHAQSQPCPLCSTSTAACCTISTLNSNPERNGRGSFCAACSYHGLTLPQSATSCSCASSTCAIASQPISSPRAPSSRSRLLQT